MTDPIFNQEKITKGTLYTRLKAILVQSGWLNVSSKPATDFDVFYSPGEDGDKSLYIQLRDANLYNANATATTAFGVIIFRLVGSYSPGTAGAAGTFGRAATWYDMRISQDIAATSYVNLFWTCNKNRLIFATESLSVDNFGGALGFIGMSDTQLAYEAKGCVVVASTSSAMNAATGYCAISDNPYQNNLTNSYFGTIIGNATLTGLNAARKRFVTDLVYGSTTDGARGIIDGVYALNNSGIMRGDSLVSETGGIYRIFQVIQANSVNASNVAATHYNGFPTNYLVIRIE